MALLSQRTPAVGAAVPGAAAVVLCVDALDAVALEAVVLGVDVLCAHVASAT